MKTALVLSGGGMFGAWQAGAWRALAQDFQPDLIVGASVGSLNGYLIASGWDPDHLCSWWTRPEAVGTHVLGADAPQREIASLLGFKRLPQLVDTMIAARPLERDYAVVIVDALRMKPVTILGTDVTAAHLLASCAVPGAFPPQRIGHMGRHRWYVDGGLLNPVPVFAAVELGATRIIALNVLPKVPSALLSPFVKGFRMAFGHHPPLPSGVELTMLLPSSPLGSMRDALVWNRQNAERWVAQGSGDAERMLERV